MSEFVPIPWATPGSNSVFNVSGYLQDGIHVVSYVRPLATGETEDQLIDELARFYLFAQGTMDAAGLPTNHGPDSRGIVEIPLGQAESTCNALLPNGPPGDGGDGVMPPGPGPDNGSAATLKTGFAFAMLFSGCMLL